jgi:hypothetical protein
MFLITIIMKDIFKSVKKAKHLLILISDIYL